MRAFAGIDLAVENVPDATTLPKSRRLLLEHDLTRKLLDEIGISLCERKRCADCSRLAYSVNADAGFFI